MSALVPCEAVLHRFQVSYRITGKPVYGRLTAPVAFESLDPDPYEDWIRQHPQTEAVDWRYLGERRVQGFVLQRQP